MRRARDLVVANVAALVLLLVVVLMGWWDAAGFGFIVLIVLDLVVISREWRVGRSPAPEAESEARETDEDGGE